MSSRSWFKNNLKYINRILLFAIIIINIYIILTPLAPQITYQVKDKINEQKNVETSEAKQEIDRSFNHVIIPRMDLDQKILVGDNEKLVNRGLWHIPHSSTPNKGSNTVIVGHRFSYKNAAVLYHLDKVKINDPIVMAWEGKLYTYKVTETKIVKPTEVEIEDPTSENILTIYTCHPLWSTKERLVVVANLETVE